MHAEPDWQLVRRVFEDTVEQPAASRLVSVERALSSRRDLLEPVRRLIAASEICESPLDETAGALLGAPLDETVAGLATNRANSNSSASTSTGTSTDADAGDMIGRRIGDCRVLSLISSGGMGEVYLGERELGEVRQRVAIKLLRHGLDSEALLARFRLEQRTLAALQHDHIVGFLDAGVLDNGRPWLVMEHVQGLPITEHVRRQALDPRGIVRLMLSVCGAVQFAHARLVLHRDLKPGNILVAESGSPKLLDFGVAKLLRPERARPDARDTRDTCDTSDTSDTGDATGATDARDATDATSGMPPITPRYASPEQWRGEPASVATDVHGLGLVLFELLAGRPADGAGTRLPSECAPTAARRVLRGDLDAIVQQSLAAEPPKRYASVEALAADLQRWLDDEPVSAHRAPAAERAARWLRRHRWSAAVGALLIASLLAGFVGTWIERERALAEASRGWGAHGQARRAALFLGELLESGEPEPWRSADVASRIDTELAPSPEAESLVRLALGRQAQARGDVASAITHFERALAISNDGRGLNRLDLPRVREMLEAARRQSAAMNTGSGESP